ncbi:MAG TPA: hypothetical protein VHV74_12380 [Pseudonocardiaceae bacterium]|nr:hypothetical protein [Pseudonocardiaceae bacterium]
MSRAEHSTTTRRRVLSGVVPSVLGVGLAAVLMAGCSAGQITQTATQEPVVNGASGMAGPIAIRDAQLAFPSNAQGTYQPGSTARLIVTIVNTGIADDTLTKITSPAATSVRIDGSDTGTKLLPGGFSVASGQDSDDESAGAAGSGSAAAPTTTQPSVAPSSGAPSSGAPAGGAVPPPAPTSSAPSQPQTVTIDLVGIRSVNGAPLRAGLTIPLTFYFQRSGQVTLPQVPIGAPADSSS